MEDLFMNPVEEFEKRFEEQITDLLVLIKEPVGAAAIVDNMLRPSVEFIASVNTQTGEFSRETGQLEWMIKNSKLRIGWGYDFKQYQICHIQARKCIPIPLKPYMRKTVNNCYMVVKVLEKNASEPRLDAVKEHVMQPVSIVDDVLGTFELNRRFSWFEGTVDWLGEQCSVSLETDEEDGETAKNALAHLKKLYEDRKEWEDKFRQFAADELWELANDWYECDDEDWDEDEEYDEDVIHITKEQFLDRISIISITVYPSGRLTLYYDADDMFTDHAIEIDANINGDMKSADIVG